MNPPLYRKLLSICAALMVIAGTVIVTGPAYASIWVPYDNSAITSAQNCENRRAWLINNVNWINQSNSRCQTFSQPACPRPTTYWKVMVLVASPRIAPAEGSTESPAPKSAATC
jgi:hypothetical protein